MTQKLFSVFRYTAIVALVASLFIMSGCDEDEGPQVFNGTLLDYLKSNEFKQSTTGSADNALDSLVKYVSLYPDLAGLLSGSAEFTVFAPSNTAFKNLLLTPGFPPKISDISPTIVGGVLSYHFVEGKKLKADLTAGTKLNTKFTDPAAPGAAQIIEINANGTLKTGSTNQDLDIVVADKLANNGVVHIVESVLIAPSTGSSLTPILGTMAGTILLGKDFTFLAQIIAKADAGFTENPSAGALKIASHLARPTSGTFTGATFFAPPNAVITAAAGSAGVTTYINNLTADAARSLLLRHYVIGKYVVTAAAGSTAFSTLLPAGSTTGTGSISANVNLGGKSVTVSISTASTQNPFGVAVSTTPTIANSFAPIVSKDLPHTNGVVQVIGGILQ